MLEPRPNKKIFGVPLGLSIYNKAKKFGRVIIVDDFSNDGTRTLLKENKIFFIKNKKNYGYEKSLINGFKYAIKKYKNADYILTIDADNELPVKYISKIQKKIKSNKAEIVIGRRNQFNRYAEKLISITFKNLSVFFCCSSQIFSSQTFSA